MKDVRLTITENRPAAAGVYRMVLAGDVSAVRAPGQFINIALPGRFLRRPISVCNLILEDFSHGNAEKARAGAPAGESTQQKAAVPLMQKASGAADTGRDAKAAVPLMQKASGAADTDRDAIDAASGSVTILYKITGEGTAQMAEMPPGTELDVLTGLGNGFDTDKVCKGQTALLLGGGIGSAPMPMLAHRLLEKGVRVKAVLGFNRAEEVILADELEAAGAEVTVMIAEPTSAAALTGQTKNKHQETGAASDDPADRHTAAALTGQTKNNHQETGAASDDPADRHTAAETLSPETKISITYGAGFVTDAPAVHSGAYDYYYACGPMPMLRAVFRTCAGKEGELSFEERMGCGFGACMGCSMQTASGPKRVCRDGPVFPASELLWNES